MAQTRGIVDGQTVGVRLCFAVVPVGVPESLHTKPHSGIFVNARGDSVSPEQATARAPNTECA